MQASARWLVPAAALVLAVGAGYALLPGLQSGPDPTRAAGGLDWAGMLAGFPDEGFAPLTGAWRLELPGDHGGHPDARTETWTVSAQLQGEGGEDVGIQLALVRVGLVPPDAPPRESPWEPRAVHRGHVTLVDGERDAAVGEERFHRDVPGVAGTDAAGRRVWLDNWSIRYGEGADGDRLRLEATVGGTVLELRLAPAKPAFALNTDGGGAPFRGYAITRMGAEGSIGDGTGRRAVSGLAWLDHLWGDIPLPGGPIALDRLLLQLDDGTDLSVTRTRRRDGGGTATLAGFTVGPRGDVEQLAGASLEMGATRAWRRDGAEYPLDWRLAADGLQLTVVPVVDDQLHDFVAPIWSGMVTAEGRLRGRRVSGSGTLLLTGYAGR